MQQNGFDCDCLLASDCVCLLANESDCVCLLANESDCDLYEANEYESGFVSIGCEHDGDFR
jgi:hypothetical protein